MPAVPYDSLPNFCTPLMEAGNYLRPLFADDQAGGKWALRVSGPLDRRAINIINNWKGTYPAHGWTERYTYTVPAGYFGILQAVYMYVPTPSAGAYALVRVEIDGIYVMMEGSISTTTYDNCWRRLPAPIWLPQGSIVSVDSYSNSTTNLSFDVATHILRYAR